MIAAVADSASRRKCLLFSTACCRRPHVWDRLAIRGRSYLARVEAWVESGIERGFGKLWSTRGINEIALSTVRRIPGSGWPRSGNVCVETASAVAAGILDVVPWMDGMPGEYEWTLGELQATAWGAAMVAEARGAFLHEWEETADIDLEGLWAGMWRDYVWNPEMVRVRGQARRVESRHLCDIARDVFPPPGFRMPEKRRRDAQGREIPRHLADSIYADRSWDKLPELAAWLGPPTGPLGPLVQHLTRTLQHHLGCWALDLLLGKG